MKKEKPVLKARDIPNADWDTPSGNSPEDVWRKNQQKTEKEQEDATSAKEVLKKIKGIPESPLERPEEISPEIWQKIIRRDGRIDPRKVFSVWDNLSEKQKDILEATSLEHQRLDKKDDLDSLPKGQTRTEANFGITGTRQGEKAFFQQLITDYEGGGEKKLEEEKQVSPTEEPRLTRAQLLQLQQKEQKRGLEKARRDELDKLRQEEKQERSFFGRFFGKK